MYSLQLHRQLTQQFATIGLQATRPQRRNLALLCQTLAFSPNCHLATLALGLPLPGRRENLIQHLRRTLKNQHLCTATCYQPLAQHVLTDWPDRDINLVMDRTDLENRLSLLTLGAAYQKRLVPLAWEVLDFGSTTTAEQTTLLKRVQPALPPLSQVQVTFYGDSEFRPIDLQRLCQEYGWHWHVGLKSDWWLRTPDGVWQSLKALHLQPGERRYLAGIELTREYQFGPLNLLADWSPNQEAPRYWAVDRPADGRAWRRGRKRYWIEPTFRDWKSYGFDLEQSQLTDAHRLDVLLLGLALTTVWLMHVGAELFRTGRAAELEPTAQKDYSLFRIGRDYLQRCRTLERAVPVGFTLRR